MAQKGRRGRTLCRGKVWRVEEVKDPNDEVSHLPTYGYSKPRTKCLGLIDPPKGRILVRRGLGKQELSATLLHERIHLVAPMLSEVMVRRLEEGLIRFLMYHGYEYKFTNED